MNFQEMYNVLYDFYRTKEEPKKKKILKTILLKERLLLREMQKEEGKSEYQAFFLEESLPIMEKNGEKKYHLQETGEILPMEKICEEKIKEYYFSKATAIGNYVNLLNVLRTNTKVVRNNTECLLYLEIMLDIIEKSYFAEKEEWKKELLTLQSSLKKGEKTPISEEFFIRSLITFIYEKLSVYTEFQLPINTEEIYRR